MHGRVLGDVLMRRAGASILVALLAIAGCKSTDPKTAEKDRNPQATPVARAKGQTPEWLDQLAKAPAAGTTIPKAETWADPKDPNYDPSSEGRGLFAGTVLDLSGRPAKGVFIRVEPSDAQAAKSGPPIGIYTNDGGYFMTRGLKPDQGYVLTAEARVDGKPLVGVVQARPPSANLTIRLRDDLDPSLQPTTGVVTLPPPAAADLIPPEAVPTQPPADGGWTPGGVPPRRNVVDPLGLPPAPLAPAKPPRPENVADRPTAPWSPPVSIPGPGVPRLTNPPVAPLPPNPADNKNSSRTVPARSNVTLIDTLGRPWNLATSRTEQLVLMEFITTTCVPCRKATPTLIDLQSRFGPQGLEVIAVVCDPGTVSERRAKAARYQQELNLNYGLYVEPGAEAGAVRDRFGVEEYPTAVLLDARGKVVWKGHPGNTAALVAAVRQQLGQSGEVGSAR